MYGLAFFEVALTYGDGTAKIRYVDALHASSNDLVYLMLSPRIEPGRFLCLWVEDSSSISSGIADQTVMLCPALERILANAMPHVPAPITDIFAMNVIPVSGLTTVVIIAKQD